jgi:hypothetical protein
MLRSFGSFLFFCFIYNFTVAQKSFIGIAKYKMTVIGSTYAKTDSMKIIFGIDKIKTIFYLPANDNSSKIMEKAYIDDFTTNTSIDIDQNGMTFTVSPMNLSEGFTFSNTNKYDAVISNLCLIYKADSMKFDRTKLSKVECFASIDYGFTKVKNYFFFGVQPIIIDNRIVLNFTTTQKDGLKPFVNLYDLKKMDDTESYFSLWGLKQK